MILLTHSNSFTLTKLSFHFSSLFFKRFMLSSRGLLAGRAIYHGYQVLTNDKVMRAPTKTAPQEIAKASGIYAMDDSQGIPQQKENIMTHIITHSFKSNDIYDALKQAIPCLTFDSDLTVDFRSLKEIPVLLELYLKYKKSIINIHVTGDKSVTKFTFKTQANPDALVTIKTKEPTFGDNIFNLNKKTIPLDEKGGMGMFDSATKGTMGLLSYDKDYRNIQITSKPIPLEYFEDFNIRRLRGIVDGLKYDNLDPALPKALITEYSPLFREAIQKQPINYPQIIALHNALQNNLWDNVQCDPKYNRSVSLVFIKQIAEPEYNPQFDAFHKEFVSLLEDRFYNLDKRGDRRTITKAMLLAYNKKVDPLLFKKLQYLQHEAKISFSSIFLDDLLKTFQT